MRRPWAKGGRDEGASADWAARCQSESSANGLDESQGRAPRGAPPPAASDWVRSCHSVAERVVIGCSVVGGAEGRGSVEGVGVSRLRGCPGFGAGLGAVPAPALSRFWCLSPGGVSPACPVLSW